MKRLSIAILIATTVITDVNAQEFNSDIVLKSHQQATIGLADQSVTCAQAHWTLAETSNHGSPAIYNIHQQLVEQFLEVASRRYDEALSSSDDSDSLTGKSLAEAKFNEDLYDSFDGLAARWTHEYDYDLAELRALVNEYVGISCRPIINDEAGAFKLWYEMFLERNML